jgi:hypothetical protein
VQSLQDQFRPTGLHYYRHDNFTPWDTKQQEVHIVSESCSVATGNWYKLQLPSCALTVQDSLRIFRKEIDTVTSVEGIDLYIIT